MDKLVVLELEGDLPTLGFRATLEIHSEDSSHPIKIKGSLPPDSELATHLKHLWDENYRSLVSPSRIKGKKIIHTGSINKRIAECRESAQGLRDSLRAWLDSKAFGALTDACEKNSTETKRFGF